MPFYTDEHRRWLCNYQPIIADQICRARSEVERRRASLASRERHAAANTGWGSGAVPGISAKADARLRALPARFLILK